MSEQKKKQAVARGDVLTGAVIISISLLASIEAFNFDSASRMFPGFMSVLLIIAGLALIVLAVVKPGDAAGATGGLAGPALACFVIAAWAAALAMGAGFVIPTFFMQMALLRMTGIRKAAFLIGIAALVTLSAYLMFAVLLDVTLPPSRLPAMLQGL